MWERERDTFSLLEMLAKYQLKPVELELNIHRKMFNITSNFVTRVSTADAVKDPFFPAQARNEEPEQTISNLF